MSPNKIGCFMLKYWLVFVLLCNCSAIKSNNNNLQASETEDECHYFDVSYHDYEQGGKIYHLESFYLPSGVSIEEYFKNSISSRNIIPAKELINLPNLEKLWIRGNIENLSFLLSITQLKSLILECGGSERYEYNFLEPLKYLSNLEYLQLEGLYGQDISPIANLRKLKDLIIGNYSEKINIEQFGKLTSLESLVLENHNGKLNIDSKLFINLKKLEYLAIIMAGEIDIAPVGILSELKHLTIGSNDKINNISLLKNPELQTLYIYHRANSYPDNAEHYLNLDWLLNLTGLKELCIYCRVISDVRPLLKLPHLEKVQIRDISNIDILMPLLESNTIKELFIDQKYYDKFPIKTFEEHGIKIWTDGWE
jgi:hypothetical protein